MTQSPPETAPRTVVIVMFDRVQSLDVTGPLEVFSVATAVCAATSGDPGYRVLTAALGARPVCTSSGLVLTPHADLRALAAAGGGAADSRPGEGPALDLLLVAGGEGARDADPDVAAWVGKLAPRARRVASVCTGTFVLAEAGLLSGRTVTTHWAYCAAFAEQYPDVAVRGEEILVRDGDVVTSGGVTAGVDLALALVAEDTGRRTARIAARHLVVNMNRPGGQAPFGWERLPGRRAASRAGPLADLCRHIAEHPDADLSVAALARRVNLSQRQLTRAFHAETGTSPGQYVDAARLAAACRLLEETTLPVEAVARRCGYGTAEAMRRAFARGVGIPPTEYRRRF